MALSIQTRRILVMLSLIAVFLIGVVTMLVSSFRFESFPSGADKLFFIYPLILSILTGLLSIGLMMKYLISIVREDSSAHNWFNKPAWKSLGLFVATLLTGASLLMAFIRPEHLFIVGGLTVGSISFIAVIVLGVVMWRDGEAPAPEDRPLLNRQDNGVPLGTYSSSVPAQTNVVAPSPAASPSNATQVPGVSAQLSASSVTRDSGVVPPAATPPAAPAPAAPASAVSVFPTLASGERSSEVDKKGSINASGAAL